MKPGVAFVLLTLAACATLPEAGGGGANLPNASAGPFRSIDATELSQSLFLTPPNAIDDSSTYGRDIAVVRADDDPSSMSVVAYVAAASGTSPTPPTPTTPTSTIVRYAALDGRSFDYRNTRVVLEADEPWEGGVMRAPAAVLVGSKTYLFYAAKGGIGLATSADGSTFTKHGSPVLAPDPSGWERGASLASPGVVALADGSLRMFYEVAVSSEASFIGEASSPDGSTWTRLGAGPALAPSGGGDSDVTPWDARSVATPFPERATSSDGRAILRLYYAATDATGVTTIALAARYGTDGPFSRADAPVFGTQGPKNPREPCVVSFAAATLLYVTEPSDTTQSATPAIAVGVAPALGTLPPPIPM